MSIVAISELMTPLPITVHSTTLVKDAKRKMYDHQIRHLPVVDGGKLVGIVSDRDIKLAQSVTSDPEFDRSAIGDVLVSDVFSCEPNTPAYEVLDFLVQNHIGSAVIEDAGKVIGIFTLTDACAALADKLRPKH